MVRFLTHNLNRLSWKLVAFSTFHIPYIVPDFQLFFFYMVKIFTYGISAIVPCVISIISVIIILLIKLLIKLKFSFVKD